MSTFKKILNSWWVVLSAVVVINGLGFMYIGLKNNNRNWIIEGVMYEIPWIFGIVFVDIDPIVDIYIAIALVFMLISIVRSIWVAIKLSDVYDNEEKYAIQTTDLNNDNASKDDSDFPLTAACCSCIVLIFIAFAIMSAL